MSKIQAQASLQEYLEKQEQTEKEAFTVDTDEKANWALRKIAQYEEQKKANNKLATDEIEKIENWNKEENEKAQQSIDYFQGLLARYAMTKRENDPKFKSQKLPNGRIRFKKKQPKWEYDDNTVIQSLKDAGMTDYIKVKESPSKSDIKKAFEVIDGQVVDADTGQIIDGITVAEQNEEFEVKVDE
ncbi:host-nuclease inhibitor Gam family protein [Lentibacillus salicampi]|uniref:Nuclease inhibitor protein n=1 Tax=Lentibacillus salicampi TaxID=175306 RepID=A0A4Y9AB65_9BACI|nr:host-nuclease inhibitor Gam family protein [Lentibacillus salicampi]TFJ92170.1 nuclease inhibitor protein [Lentibacillus salicampi]